jgi:hypothetical protein
MQLIALGEGAVSGTVDALSIRFSAVAVDDDDQVDEGRVIVMQRVRLLACSLQGARSRSDTLSSQQEDRTSPRQWCRGAYDEASVASSTATTTTTNPNNQLDAVTPIQQMQ